MFSIDKKEKHLLSSVIILMISLLFYPPCLFSQVTDTGELSYESSTGESYDDFFKMSLDELMRQKFNYWLHS